MHTYNPPPVQVAPNAAGAAVADTIKGLSTVQDVVPSRCMKVLEGEATATVT